MSRHPKTLPSIVTEAGSLDPLRLQEALYTLLDDIVETHHVSELALAESKKTNGRVDALEAWRRGVEKVSIYADGVAAGSQKILGFAHTSVILAFGFVGSLGGLFGAFVAAKNAGLF